jgi:Fe-S-cluster containining protein
MDIGKFKQKAARRKKVLTAFLSKFDEIVPEDLPQLVEEEEAKVWNEIDCTQCANCCKTMTPTYNKEDVTRIAAHLRMQPKVFIQKYLKKEPDSKDWVNKEVPCVFLVDDKCSIYSIRPLDCAEFPHHNKKPFDEYTQTFKNNLVHCPATLQLISAIKQRVERDYEWE